LSERGDTILEASSRLGVVRVKSFKDEERDAEYRLDKMIEYELENLGEEE